MSFEHGRSTVVSTDKGKLRGYRKNGIYHYFNIPYAKAERFCAPVEAEAWDGVKEATSYGYIAKQMMPEIIGDDLATPHRFYPQSEDCLNLNVWTPGVDDAKRDVIVWFHGGGFFAGSSIEQVAYDGYNLAKRGNVVVVTVNHRLNLLGYLDLRKYGEKYIHSANAGNLDLVAALRWVKRNIERFGGNPDSVTIFGQSGGGGKVISLMNMPSAFGLFHKAMIMSGTLGDFLSDEGVDTSSVVEAFLKKLNLNKDNIEEIESMDYSVLTKAYWEANAECGIAGPPFFAPQRGVDYLGDPMHVGFSEFAKGVPVIIGSTFAEFSSLKGKADRFAKESVVYPYVKEMFHEGVDRVLEKFEKAFPEKKMVDVLTYDADVFRLGSIEYAKKRVAEGCAPTYLYLFCPTMKLNESSMPMHCADIPYVFANTDLVASSDIGRATKRLEKEIVTRFLHFAHTGDVNCENYLKWNECKEGETYTYLYQETCEQRCNFDEDLLREMKQWKKPFSFAENLEKEEK